MRFRFASAVTVAVAALALVCAAGAAAAPASCPSGWTQNRQPDLTGTLPCNFVDLGFGGPGHATNTTETVTVPAGVSVLHMNAVGGVGDSPDCNYPDEVYGDLAVTPGERLTVIAGNAGQHLSQPAGGVPAIPGQGGFGGGGNGGTGYNGAGNGGGGGSFVFGPSGVLLVSGGTGGAFEQQNFETWGGGGQAWANTQMECPLSSSDPPALLSTAGAGLAGGQGATGSGAGDGGAGPSDGTDGTNGGGPASSSGSLGTGGQGATGNVDNQGSNGGGGGGGGYYGGGGGGDASGGGSGSDYLSSSLVGGSGHDVANPNWKFGDANGGGGVVDLSFTPVGTEISGTILTPLGDGWSGATVELTGTDSTTNQAVDRTTTTASDGSYSFALDPGRYTVTPQVAQAYLPAGADQYTPTECDNGALGTGACTGIALATDQNDVANFTAGYTVKGKVTGDDTSGVQGVTVEFKDTEQGSVHSTTATTDASGSFSVSLAPGSVQAFADDLNGTMFFPVPSADCATSGDSCTVNLNQDRTIAFSSCVVPNPDGSPLPPNTPDPIPGAVEAPPLEAVGCWTPGPGANPTTYTSTQPVRLDGIDVKPAPGTTLTLNKSIPQVTADGPAQVLIDGWDVTLPIPLDLTYQSGIAPAGSSNLSIQDLGAGSGPAAIGASLFGIPISLGTGSSLGYGLPFIETTGQTQVNLSSQFVLPGDTHSSWNFLQGKFLDADGNPVPSIGLSGQINLTNRYGIQAGQICGSVNDWKPFGDEGGEISGLQLCWNPTQRQLSGLGMFELPKAAQKIAGDVYVQVTLQQAGSRNGQLQGYQLAAAQIEFDHLNTSSFPAVPGLTQLDIKDSGIPIGLGMYVQDLRAGFFNNLAGSNSLTYITDPLILQVMNALAHPLAGTLSNVYGGIGMSFGPEITANGFPVGLFRLDGTVSLTPPQGGPNDNWVAQVSAKGTFARLSPVEMKLADASLTYQFSLSAPEADFEAHVGATQGSFWSKVGGYSSDLRGVIDNNVGNLFEGVETLKVGPATFSKDVLIWIDPFKNQATLAACFQAGPVLAGFDYNLITGKYDGFCNMSAFQHPVLTPQATDSSAGRGGPRIPLRLPGGRAAIELAIRGHRAPPLVTLTGGGETIVDRKHAGPQLSSRALIFTDRQHDTTFVVLLHPAGGRWTIRPVRGSAPIVSVLQSQSLPAPRITGRFTSHGCKRQFRYRLKPARGVQVILYAQLGSNRTLLGRPTHRSGRYTIPAFSGASGRGQVVAFLVRDGRPIGTETVATFNQTARCGRTR